MRRKNMKREDLKTRLTNAGIAEDKLSEVVDYIMSQNGADVNSLREEITTLKATHEKELKAVQDESASLKTRVEAYKDYEDLKKFKEETIEKAENSKKVEFLKSQGCKYPDLVISKIDFSKAEYDEAGKTYKGLDDAIKGLKTSYAGMFDGEVQRANPTPTASDNPSSDFEKYKEAHPNWHFE